MQKQLLMALFSLIMTFMSEDNLKKAADFLLDMAEDWAEGDPTTEEDDKKIVQALCARIRKTFDIPDNDE